MKLVYGGVLRNAIGLLLRAYSYLFHLILSIFLIGIASLASMADKPLKLDVLPWEGFKLNHWVLGLGVIGIVCVLLAVTGLFRYVFPLWALFVLAMMFRGFFLTPYSFSGESEFKGACWLTFGAFGAFLSSLSVLDLRSKRR